MTVAEHLVQHCGQRRDLALRATRLQQHLDFMTLEHARHPPPSRSDGREIRPKRLVFWRQRPRPVAPEFPEEPVPESTEPPPSAPTRLEHLRRELPTQVLRGGARRTPAPRSALEEADLDEIRLVDLLEGLSILADRGG